MPSNHCENNSAPDEKLVIQAQKGNRQALEELIKRHQGWIYNIALRMVADPDDAQDVAQEVLLIIITKLSTFKGKSRFRTWVYRIVSNYVINMKKRRTEKILSSFDHYGRLIDDAPDREMPDQKAIPVELPLLLKEIRTHCMMGMLLCLNRKERLIFILGEIFKVNDLVGSEIFEITKPNFRKRLSRARKKVFDFMKAKCGLIDKENSCHCERKAQAMIDHRAVDPTHLRFVGKSRNNADHIYEEKYTRLDDYLDSKCRSLFQTIPFLDPPDYVKAFRKILNSNEFRDIFEFTD